MTASVLPAALLCAALGLALAFAPRRTWTPALLALAAAAIAASLLDLGSRWRAPLLVGCWLSVLLAAAAAHAPGGAGRALALLVSVNAGAWSGLVVGGPAAVLLALPWALLCLPGAWIVARGWGVALKVLASWLAAIALLGAALPTLSTPGYEPDHMN